MGKKLIKFKMISQTFTEWRNCIINKCKINLTKEFAQQRLTVYEEAANHETKKFIALYGSLHYSNIINWLNKIKND